MQAIYFNAREMYFILISKVVILFCYRMHITNEMIVLISKVNLKN